MPRRAREAGQILPLMALALVAMFAMAALLFDGANALSIRRRLQNVGDAAALAAANQLQVTSNGVRGCAAASGQPRASVVQAATDSVAANAPDYPSADVVVTCPSGWDNSAVRVSLTAVAPTFFGGVIGITNLSANTTSTAVNGRISAISHSIVELNPWKPTWPQGRRGCPSVLLSGGPTVVLEGSMQINSACPASDGGGLGTNGNAASLSMLNGARIRIVGGFAPGPLTINPAPLTGQVAVRDPLASLPPVPVSSLTVRSTTKLVLNNQSQVLHPGVYRGGIELRNSSRAFLRPGIYVLEGGGLSVGAQAQLFSVGPTVNSTSDGTWASDCPWSTCGVLVYNTSGSSAMGAINIQAGALVKLRSYRPDAVGGQHPDYERILFWQDASPVPTNSYEQPVMNLIGGGGVDLSGTVYAPSAAVAMKGNSGGSGGTAVDLTLQFITWDLSLQGNSAFTFRYRSSEFARLTDYGLIE